MPGRNDNGTFDATSGGDYYCDANKGEGSWCPEMDMMEANKYAWRTTPHKCDAPNSNGHYYNCDRGGCGKSIWSVDPRAYGPGSNFRINTNYPFHVKLEFPEQGGRLSKIVINLTQNSNSFSMTIADSDCAQGYLTDMSAALKAGMTTAVSNWGTTMGWLDNETHC